jgi:hypothetical protein
VPTPAAINKSDTLNTARTEAYESNASIFDLLLGSSLNSLCCPRYAETDGRTRRVFLDAMAMR